MPVQSIRCALGAAIFGGLLAAGTVVSHDKYPSKQITIVVTQAPGGANDTIARIWAAKLSENIKQPVIIDNRAGAGGNIGTVYAAKASKDGYTLLLTLSSAHVTNP